MIKEYFKKTPVAPLLRAGRDFLKPKHPIQKIQPSTEYNFLCLGSDYGGWKFVDAPYLRGAQIISAGLGTDASFDVEFARLYGASVIAVDPTPGAVMHFRELVDRLGEPRMRYARKWCTREFELGGVSGWNGSTTNHSAMKDTPWKTIPMIRPRDQQPRPTIHSRRCCVAVHAIC